MNPRGGKHSLIDVRVTQNVEPMPRIAHAVLIAGEEFVHQYDLRTILYRTEEHADRYRHVFEHDLGTGLLLFGMFIPYQSILIPLVQFLETINLYGGIPGLILVHVVYGIPICTLIFRNYFATVPRELLEAARIDGASVIGIYRHVMLPISIPGFVVVMIWQFTSIWNEFLFAVTIAQTPTQQPITVALQNLAGSLAPEQNIQMAGALMAALPTLLIYILLGRYFVRGLLAGSLKG